MYFYSIWYLTYAEAFFAGQT